MTDREPAHHRPTHLTVILERWEQVSVDYDMRARTRSVCLELTPDQQSALRALVDEQPLALALNWSPMP